MDEEEPKKQDESVASLESIATLESVATLEPDPPLKKIKHLVIPGGGPTGIIALGTLQHLEEQNYWKIADIESIYATSVGTFLATFIAFGFEWSMITDYIIKRPWHDAIQITPNMFFDAYSKKGLLDRSAIEIIFKPFFAIKEWSFDLTMTQFYEITKKDIHFFTLEVNAFEIIDINYRTFPDLPILTAIQMSSALPGIICPVFIGDKCYVDGGVLCNYPLKKCLDNVEDPDSIFAINNYYIKGGENMIKHESTILDYMVNFITSMVFSVGVPFLTEPGCIKNELIYERYSMTLDDLKELLYNQKTREELYEVGIKGAIEYLVKISHNIENQSEECTKESLH
jgi:predicted acylesterase/phospholipase RssA